MKSFNVISMEEANDHGSSGRGPLGPARGATVLQGAGCGHYWQSYTITAWLAT